MADGALHFLLLAPLPSLPGAKPLLTACSRISHCFCCCRRPIVFLTIIITAHFVFSSLRYVTDAIMPLAFNALEVGNATELSILQDTLARRPSPTMNILGKRGSAEWRKPLNIVYLYTHIYYRNRITCSLLHIKSRKYTRAARRVHLVFLSCTATNRESSQHLRTRPRSHHGGVTFHEGATGWGVWLIHREINMSSRWELLEACIY